MVQDVGAVVISIGGYATKAGEAGEDTPKAVLPTVRSLALDAFPHRDLLIRLVERWFRSQAAQRKLRWANCESTFTR